MKLLIAGLAALAVASCATGFELGTTTHTFTTPDGRAGYIIECAGMSYCYARARKLCGGNYTLSNRTERLQTNQITGLSDQRSIEAVCEATLTPK